VRISAIAVLALACATSLAQSDLHRGQEEVEALPAEIRSVLKKQRCRIPLGILGHTNVIKGSFAKQGQVDWAVLCSISGKSRIQVFWGGPVRCPDRLAVRSDEIYLQRGVDGKFEFSRGLGIVGEEFILRHHRAYGGPTPHPITHDAIDDRYLGKASVVHYCYEGKWIELTGAD